MSVDNPSYYQFKTQPYDYALDITHDLQATEAICVFNVIKYISRYSKKNGIDDVKKALWYMQKLEKHLEQK